MSAWKGLILSQPPCTRSIRVSGSIHYCCSLYPAQKPTGTVTEMSGATRPGYHFELQGRDVSDWICGDFRDRKVLQLTGHNFPLHHSQDTKNATSQNHTKGVSLHLDDTVCLKCQLKYTVYFSNIGEDGGIKQKLAVLVMHL